MKRIPDTFNRLRTHDGWALQRVGQSATWRWTFSTTRQEARELRDELAEVQGDLFTRATVRVVKVRVALEVVT